MDDAELVRAAFLRRLQEDNDCDLTGKPCHSHKCGCALEMHAYIDESRSVLGQGLE